MLFYVTGHISNQLSTRYIDNIDMTFFACDLLCLIDNEDISEHYEHPNQTVY